MESYLRSKGVIYMSGNKKSKLMKEQEEIRRLRSVSTILNMGDIENAVLANTSKESEPVSDDIIDELLNNAASASSSPQEQKNLDSLEKMTTGGTVHATVTAKRTNPSRRPKSSASRQKARKPAARKAQPRRPKEAVGKKKRSNKR